MTQLSVNVNKIATLRNARGKNNPDVLTTALDIIRFGAGGITVHPRPDGRHIRRQDVYDLAASVDVEFNIEGYPDDNFLSLVSDVKPTQCTLVPDPPDVLTSNAGWSIASHHARLREVIAALHKDNIRTSLFIDPFNITPKELDLLAQTRTNRIELYTEAYANSVGQKNQAHVLNVYRTVATDVEALGIGLNAGHDLNLDNLELFITTIPSILEVSIGHALICDALYFGLEETIQRYLQCLGKK